MTDDKRKVTMLLFASAADADIISRSRLQSMDRGVVLRAIARARLVTVDGVERENRLSERLHGLAVWPEGVASTEYRGLVEGFSREADHMMDQLDAATARIAALEADLTEARWMAVQVGAELVRSKDDASLDSLTVEENELDHDWRDTIERYRKELAE